MDTDRHIRHRFKVRNDLSYPSICLRGGRERLAEIFSELGYTVGVEIGTRVGSYAKTLCDKNPALNLTCVDPYLAYNRLDQEHQNRYFEEATARLTPYGVTIIRKPSLEAVDSFADKSLDFVFIDGDHAFDAVMQDIIKWTQKVRPGGIVAGHDYSMFPEVARAAEVYIICHKIAPWYLIRELESTFFWVNK